MRQEGIEGMSLVLGSIPDGAGRMSRYKQGIDTLASTRYSVTVRERVLIRTRTRLVPKKVTD